MGLGFIAPMPSISYRVPRHHLDEPRGILVEMACNPATQSPVRAGQRARGRVVRLAQNTDAQPRNVLQLGPCGGRILHAERRDLHAN
jgi:hypothetical protein